MAVWPRSRSVRSPVALNGLAAMRMVVIGLDVHKQTVTAVAVGEAGRPLEEKLVQVGSDELLAWAAGLDGEQVWGG